MKGHATVKVSHQHLNGLGLKHGQSTWAMWWTKQQTDRLGMIISALLYQYNSTSALYLCLFPSHKKSQHLIIIIK
jgi:hypothetical protein